MEEKGLGFSGRCLMHDAQTSEVRASARNAENICRCREQRQRSRRNIVVCRHGDSQTIKARFDSCRVFLFKLSPCL